MKESQDTAEMAYAYLQKMCNDANIQDCVNFVSQTLREHCAKVKESMQGVRCVDMTYDPHHEMLCNDFSRLDSTSLTSALQWTRKNRFYNLDSFDFAQLYKDGENALETVEPGCMVSEVQQLKAQLEKFHENLQLCSNKMRDYETSKCKDAAKNDLIGFVYRTDKATKDNGCFNKNLTAIWLRATANINPSNNVLDKKIKNFINTEIDDGDCELMTGYIATVQRLQKAGKDACQRPYMENGKQFLEKLYSDAQECFKTDQKLTNMTRCDTQSCSRELIDRLRTYYRNDKQKFEQSQCKSPAYTGISVYMDTCIKKLDNTLYEALAWYSEMSLNDSPFDVITAYKSVFNGNADNIFGCAKNAAIKLQNLIEEANADAKKEIDNARKTFAEPNMVPIARRFKAFFRQQLSNEIPAGCVNKEFQKIIDSLADATKNTAAYLSQDLVKLGKSNIIPTMDLEQMNATISSSMYLWNFLCHGDQMPKTQQLLSAVRIDAQRCCDAPKGDRYEACFDGPLDKIRQHFTWLKGEKIQCRLQSFDDLRENGYNALKLPKTQVCSFIFLPSIISLWYLFVYLNTCLAH